MTTADLSGKTAIARKRLSAPAQYLHERELLSGRILDFGCGKGDVKRFLQGDIEQWDPSHHPRRPQGKFDAVVCIYVLNVLSPHKRRQALEAAKRYVRRGGSLYVAVRRDIKQQGLTNAGTRQYNVNLPLPCLVDRSGAFAIYHWHNN